MVQTRDARSARIEQLQYNIGLALSRNMNDQDTLGLESLGIDKILVKSAKRKARAKPKSDEQKILSQGRPPTPLKQDDMAGRPWHPPVVPSYQSLPMSPLGSSSNDWTTQPAPSFEPYAYRATPYFASYQYSQDYRPSDAQGQATNAGQGSTSVNGPSHQVNQTTSSYARPSNTASGFQKQYGRQRCIQRSSLHSRARPPSEHMGRWTDTPPMVAQQSEGQPLPLFSPDTAKSTAPTVRDFKSMTKDDVVHLPAPQPTSSYLTIAHATPTLLPSSQRLLLILDLNGTLLYRSGYVDFSPRACLKKFLAYALANHSVMIWSSATPKSVKGVCEKLFTPSQRGLLLGEWARNTLDLTPAQYKERVQVYKRLDRVWASNALQHAHPGFVNGERWGQHNTLLIDDSLMKACAQPFNHVEVPEFVQGAKESHIPILEQIVGYLEYARRWNDVSSFVREMKFGVQEGWRWNWAKGAAHEPEQFSDDEDDGGGVRL